MYLTKIEVSLDSQYREFCVTIFHINLVDGFLEEAPQPINGNFHKFKCIIFVEVAFVKLQVLQQKLHEMT